MNLQVCIMTPDKIFWDEEAEEIILPTNTGQMGVLTKHAPLITALDIGVMSIRQKNSWNFIALMNGFASIKNDKVTILVNSAESKETIQGFNKILSGELDDLPEQSFYLVGNLEEVVEKAATL